MDNNPFCVSLIGSYIPEARVDNFERAKQFDYDETALRDKIGVTATSKKDAQEDTSDLCVKAFDALAAKTDRDALLSNIDVIVVVTQHPDQFGLPHTAANLHAKLGLPLTCFAFDISLGCSGFVSALATVSGHLLTTGGNRAIIFTADPYSKSLDENDKNTSMIFGDAATATLIERDHGWRIGAFDWGTDGRAASAIQRDETGTLQMNGRSVFNFCALNIPKSLERTLEKNQISLDSIDGFALHPGSKYIVDTIVKKAKLPPVAKLPCEAYGNTVSSSIPLILEEMSPESQKNVLVSGFGVGLGWMSTVLKAERR